MIRFAVSLSRLCLPAALLLVAACGGEETPSGGPGPKGGDSAQLPESVWSEAALPDAKPVGQVRKDAKDGADVVVEGKLKDFVKGFAAFTLVDLAMESCDQKEGDNCPTPWDYCCEDSTKLAQNTVTVEVVGEDGKPLRAPLQGVHGLDHLSVLQVRGKLHRDEAGNVRLSARQIAKK